MWSQTLSQFGVLTPYVEVDLGQPEPMLNYYQYSPVAFDYSMKTAQDMKHQIDF